MLAAKQILLVHIRWHVRRDMPEILQIEQGCFAYPWNEEDLLRCLRQRNCIGMVAEHGEKVVGFMIYELHRRRLEILNLAVHPQYHRHGVGAQMVGKLISKMSSHRRTAVAVCVRETSLPAQLFFRQQEFKAIRVLPGYYEDSGEDAYRFVYSIREDQP